LLRVERRSGDEKENEEKQKRAVHDQVRHCNFNG
jgi:hypothetical protein